MATRAVLASLLAVLLPITAPALWPEAIAPTNSLPPAAGRYELWPPTARVQWAFTLDLGGGTNLPCQFDLERITIGPFSNVVRTVAADDLVLEFDAVMDTAVPYFRIGDDEEYNVYLFGQVGHLRVKVTDEAVRSNGWFSVSVESLSWTLQGHDDEGHYFDVINVRLRSSPPSTGWITVTNLPDGTSLMQSELALEAEGALVIVSTNYFAPVTGPIRLALRGTARALQFLAVASVMDEGESRLVFDNSYLGTNYQYGIEYTTNGVAWQQFGYLDDWGNDVKWFDDLDTWRDMAPLRQ
jgi:hypothetical protein